MTNQDISRKQKIANLLGTLILLFTLSQSSNSKKPCLYYPLRDGYITQGYRTEHLGIDIADELGTPIMAANSGTVSLAGFVTAAYGEGLYGNQVVIDHGMWLFTMYTHIQEIYVEEGQYVNAGEEIGTIGITGQTNGPHLHWEVWRIIYGLVPSDSNNLRFRMEKINPLYYLCSNIQTND